MRRAMKANRALVNLKGSQRKSEAGPSEHIVSIFGLVCVFWKLFILSTVWNIHGNMTTKSNMPHIPTKVRVSSP